MSMRTDLAVETAGSLTFDAEGKYEGIRKIERGSAFDITEIIVEDDESGRKIGKKKGRYLTLEAPRLSHISDRYRDMVSELCEELRSFVGNREKILVAGLGNDDITPDALGPCTASGVMATRHIRGQNTGDSFLDSLKDVSVLLTGVMGTTGIETAEIVKAVYEKTSPELIIIIDALVCSSPERLGTTIQICDTGISPGSGVENKRMEISEQTLGVPVIVTVSPALALAGLYESVPPVTVPSDTVYVDGGSAVISVVTGLHDCDGRICVPFLECDESDMEVIDIEKEIGGA